MDFTFTEDQLSLSDAIHKFLMVEAAPELLREIWETESGRSAEMRAKLADQGLTALSVPEAYGGMGLGDLDWVLIQQELGYYAIPDSLTATAYLAVYLSKALPEDSKLKAHWLPKIADGSARVAVGHPINPFVADAANASLLLLWHADELHALRPEEATLTLNASIDSSRRLYRVQWTPTDKTRVCGAEQGRELWQGVINRAGVAISAQLLGLAQRMLDLGTDYAAQRKQFGKPIGSFQALQHRAADLLIQQELTASVLAQALALLDDPKTSATARSAMASRVKARASDAGLQVAREAVQLHGAIGVTDEYDLGLYLQRALVLSAWLGNGTQQRRRYAALTRNLTEQEHA